MSEKGLNHFCWWHSEVSTSSPMSSACSASSCSSDLGRLTGDGMAPVLTFPQQSARLLPVPEQKVQLWASCCLVTRRQAFPRTKHHGWDRPIRLGGNFRPVGIEPLTVFRHVTCFFFPPWFPSPIQASPGDNYASGDWTWAPLLDLCSGWRRDESRQGKNRMIPLPPLCHCCGSTSCLLRWICKDREFMKEHDSSCISYGGVSFLILPGSKRQAPEHFLKRPTWLKAAMVLPRSWPLKVSAVTLHKEDLSLSFCSPHTFLPSLHLGLCTCHMR